MNNNIQKNNQPPFKPSDPKFISQGDFIYFKNELLQDLKVIESKIISKVKAITDEYEEKMLNMNLKLSSCQTKILELSSNFSSENSQIERVNKLYVFKSISEEKLSAQEKKLKELNDSLNESIYSMNKNVQENINYPGVIGPNSKFQNLHAFVDFVINNINNMNSFKEKMNSIDIQSYKSKFDKAMKNYKLQMDSFISSSQNLTKETVVVFDNKLNQLFITFDNKVIEEKEFVQTNLDKIHEKNNELFNNLTVMKEELSKKIDINKEELDKKIESINFKNNQFYSDFENIDKKIEEVDVFVKLKISEYDEKLKEQENNLLSKIHHLFGLMKRGGYLPAQKRNLMDTPYKSILGKDIFNDKDINTFKSLDKNIKETVPVESSIKKYIEGEITIDEIISNKERRRLQNSSKENENINKMLENDIMPLLNNLKFVKFQNEAIKNNQENSENKFIDRKKVDSYLIEKENIIINKIPRKQLIKNLLQNSSEPISNYFVKNKIEKKDILNQIRFFPKKSSASKRKILDFNNSYKHHFNNSTSHFFLKKKFEDTHDIDNEELDDLHDVNRRTFSSGNSKTRNEQNSMRQNSIMNFNTTDILKDNSNSKTKDNNRTINDNKENNINMNNNNLDKSNNSINNNNLNKHNNINNSIEKSVNNIPNYNINKDIYVQDENKEIEYHKKKTKIIHNFNSASKLFDLNIKSENFWNTKYKINPMQKNIKIIKNSGSPLNQNLKLKMDKEKEKDKLQKPQVHYYLNVKNKNKK